MVGDYAHYFDLPADYVLSHGAAIWSYFLVPNCVRIVAVPREEDALRRTLRHVHRQYTGHAKARIGVSVWLDSNQCRPADESLCLSRSIERQPAINFNKKESPASSSSLPCTCPSSSTHMKIGPQVGDWRIVSQLRT